MLCTITSFEAVIKGLSSNRARKQKQKQRNKWFCSDPSLMFTSCSSRPLRLLTSHSHLPVSFSSQHFLPHTPSPPAFPSCVWQINIFCFPKICSWNSPDFCLLGIRLFSPRIQQHGSFMLYVPIINYSYILKLIWNIASIWLWNVIFCLDEKCHPGNFLTCKF